MSVVLARETVEAIWDECQPLAEAHHAEVGPLQPKDYKPSRLKLDALEKIGLLRVYTARDQDVLVGYASFVLDPYHDFYLGMSWAMQSTLYVKPSHRDYSVIRFLRYQDLSLSMEGAEAIYRHAPTSNNLGRLLLHMGYRLNDRGYVRDLREAA